MWGEDPTIWASATMGHLKPHSRQSWCIFYQGRWKNDQYYTIWCLKYQLIHIFNTRKPKTKPQRPWWLLA